MARNVALVIGSLRKESWTRKVALSLADLAPKSLHMTPIEIRDLPLYDQDFDDEGRPPQQWVAFREQLRAMDAVIFATPEYNRSVPGVLKNAIDVGSRPYGKSIWSGKAAGVISCSPGQYGAFGANHHLRQSLVFLDMPILQQPEVYLSNINKSFTDGKLTDERTRELLSKFAVAFAAYCDRLYGVREPTRKSA
jgi:chromate reductase, NAD(P)H dehydrogenase (quinone)